MSIQLLIQHTLYIMHIEPFGQLPSGEEVSLFTLESKGGAKARITNYGGILVNLWIPDAKGEWVDVVLGFDTLEEYLGDHPYFNAIIGRYGNRIGQSSFTLEGTTYELDKNHGPHHLHGGFVGFDKQLWDAQAGTNEEGDDFVVLSLTSPDGDAGYPGTLKVEVTYTLTQDNQWIIEYEATTDKATHVNLTQHAYFNLKGAGDVLEHELMITADSITETDEALVPTGQLVEVAEGPFDFNAPKPIGADIDADDAAIKAGFGYDHNFVIRDWDDSLRLIAEVFEPSRGIFMEVSSSEPGVQLYTANHLKDLTGKGGTVYQPRTAFCLETQHFPDTPNRPEFPTTELKPGETYKSTTVYAFRA
ncbi:aldose epimerase family protein [Pontibacter sp. G13]|uniref:aldose epimerase family protein n=1 Tax=Pontibacter sp. G13 TaxID=3074898 RepID=UPI00288ACD7C|nr:aldose epimerase family protein [Pontibacter sp. G13]WNJ19604.1 aldose epimerase family protein [Pontibacter sp. G13]